MFASITAGLDKFYSNRINRVSTQLIVVFLSLLFVLHFSETATQAKGSFENKQDAVATIGGAFLLIDWLCFILLARTLFYDRIALGMGALAGFFWLWVGDAVAMPFWAGTMALFIHLCRRWGKLSNIFVWYIFLWLITVPVYGQIYSYTAHPGYLVLFIVTALAYFLYGYAQKLTARKKAAIQALRAQAEQAQEEIALRDLTLDRQISRLEKTAKLPEAIKKELVEIIASARQIRHCMDADARDVEPGRQFLQRYLPIVEKIVTKGQALVRQLDDPQKRNQSLSEQQEALASLNLAFRQQHQQLLANDKDDLNIEIKALEKILKTDGYIK